MNTHTILKTELALPAYSAMTDQERLDSLTLKNITVKQSISVLDIQRYLNLVDKLLNFEDSVSDSARKAKRTFELHESIDMTNPMIEAKFISVLDALVADANILIDANDRAYILSLGEKLISRAEELNLGVIGLGKVEEAR